MIPDIVALHSLIQFLPFWAILSEVHLIILRFSFSLGCYSLQTRKTSSNSVLGADDCILFSFVPFSSFSLTTRN